MICKKCGNEINDDAMFCPSCGANVAEMLAEEAEAKVEEKAEAVAEETEAVAEEAEAVAEEAETVVEEAEAAVENAEEKAEAAVENAEEKAEAAVENAEEKAEAAVENAEDKAESKLEEVKDEVKEKAAEVKDKVKDAAAKFDAKDFFAKNKVPVIIFAAVIVAIILICIIGSAASNTFKTPMKLQVKYANSKHRDPAGDQIDTLNGFCEKEYKQILKIMKKSDDYDKDEIKEAYEEAREMLQDEYGKNFKIKAKLDDKDKLDKDEVRDFEKELHDEGKFMLGMLEMYDDRDNIKDLADEMGISKSQAKKYVKTMKDIATKMKKANVTAGYELEYDVTIDGEDYEGLDSEITVYKIDGRWVNFDNFDLVGLF